MPPHISTNYIEVLRGTETSVLNSSRKQLLRSDVSCGPTTKAHAASGMASKAFLIRSVVWLRSATLNRPHFM